ncbi:TetR/AcrR family transcriptional regulator [Chitinophaga agrisoli]|uniref:TetR/AcrR family transcriptional regulator n=1 Tax=Chitinophaga agrisoli TaxID=2607653 RepID=A0A5B2W2W0_9BACT|nr:TetR/AcrR family transcriptional regulator [Chitinophaga agrisoli]KAA2245434.1 TetR/AcrR family transcriptional regulator [Chitinophaga agrisoli]
MSKAEKTKAFIIEKTAPVFNRKGFAGTSLTDLTDATGLTKGSIYGNFANKDEVALAVFEHNRQKVEQIVKAEMSKYTTVREQLLVYVDVYKNFLKYPFPDGGCPILNTAIEADDTHPELKEKAAAAMLAWKNRIAVLIKKGIDQGEFTTQDDPEQTALTLIALLEGAVMITKLTGKINFRNAIMQSVENMINAL